MARLFHPRRLRRLLAWPPTAPAPTLAGVFTAQARRFTTTQTLVRAFYAFLLYVAVGTFTTLPDLLGHAATASLWPVAWLRHVNAAAGPHVLMAFYLATNILGVFTASWRTGRALTFLGLLEYVALKNSFGKIGHSLHLLLWVAGVFLLLPAGWDRPAPQTPRRRRQETLLVFWLAQAAVLMSYTMSGAAKLGAACWQIVQGQANAFGPGGLSAIVAQRLLETHSTSFFGAWIVHHPYLTWPAFPAAIALELFALRAAFRPALVRPWVMGLILLHVGIYLTMTISFPQHCFLLALLFLASPFEPEPAPSWQTRLLEVLVLPNSYKFWRATRRTHGV